MLPGVRPHDNSAHRTASPLELFYDVAFVAAIGGAVLGYAHHPTWLGTWQFALLLAPIWWAWVGWTFFVDRFHADDLHHHVLFGLKVVGVMVMALASAQGYEQGLVLFALAYAAVRGALVWQYILAGISHPPARAFTTRYAWGFGLAALLWLVVAALPIGWSYLLIPLAVAVDIATPLLSWQQASVVPLSPSHLGERFMLFILIMLGEVAFSLLQAAQAHPGHELAMAASLLLPFFLWWLYYRNVSGSAIRHGRTGLSVFLFGHFPLVIGMAAVGAGMKLVWEADTATTAALLLTLGTAIAVAALGLLGSATHCQLDAPHTERRKLWSRIATAGGIAIGGVATLLAGSVISPLLLAGGLLALLAWYDVSYVLRPLPIVHTTHKKQ